MKCLPAGFPVTSKTKKVSLSFAFPQLCRTLPRHGSPWKSCTRTASPRWSFWRAPGERGPSGGRSSLTYHQDGANVLRHEKCMLEVEAPITVGCCHTWWLTVRWRYKPVVIHNQRLHPGCGSHRIFDTPIAVRSQKNTMPLAHKLSHKLVSLQRYGSSRGERNLRPEKVPSMFCEYLIGHLWYHT